jgi:DNA-binding transcriptional MerR regulator
MDGEGRRILIQEAARLLDRVPHTIRTWEWRGLLPRELHASRDEHGRRYWTPRQIEAIREWLEREDIRSSKGLKHYRPSAEQAARQRERMRGPRGPRNA